MPVLKTLLFTLLLTAATTALAAAPATAVQVGEDAPNFLVQDLNGDDPIILSDYRGRVVVLNFFWTG